MTLVGLYHNLAQAACQFIQRPRSSTIRNADRILVMERGQLIEDGSHAELTAQDGHYARLHGHQMMGAEEVGA
ncbi:MAG: hypothetical protein HY328_08030 [Chloroflexi bacterium]|nr:hypothetical protein [Chloroflexota bacterium]